MMRGPFMGYSDMVLKMLISFGFMLWFIIFSLLVLLRLDKIIKLLEKK